jgi:hypothetical protein
MALYIDVDDDDDDDCMSKSRTSMLHLQKPVVSRLRTLPRPSQVHTLARLQSPGQSAQTISQFDVNVPFVIKNVVGGVVSTGCGASVVGGGVESGLVGCGVGGFVGNGVGGLV